MSAGMHRIRSCEVFSAPGGFPLTVQRVEDHGAGRLHTHEFHELVVLLDGAGTHRTDHGDYPLRTGDVFMVRGAMGHGYADTQSMKLINILFQPGPLALPLQHLNDLPGYHALFRIEPKLRASDRFRRRLHLTQEQLAVAARHIAAIEVELDAARPGYRFAACTHLMSLLGYLSRCYADTSHPRQRPLMRLGEVLSYMESHLEQDISTHQLVRIAGMSESTLARRFRKVLGRSPVDHLIRLRMDRARRLLRDADMNITEVALACGFADSNYFSRRFKAAEGRTPRAYRAAAT